MDAMEIVREDMRQLSCQSHDQIRKQLLRDGDAGIPTEPCGCVLARRWKRLTGRSVEVYPFKGPCDDWRACVATSDDPDTAVVGRTPLVLPGQLVTFAMAFDAGDFQELIDMRIDPFTGDIRKEVPT